MESNNVTVNKSVKYTVPGLLCTPPKIYLHILYEIRQLLFAFLVQCDKGFPLSSVKRNVVALISTRKEEDESIKRGKYML